MKRSDKGRGNGDRLRLDDDTAEALIAGRRHLDSGDMATVSAFLSDVRALRQGPVPPPSAVLARILVTGLPQQDAPGADTTVGKGRAGEQAVSPNSRTERSWRAAAAGAALALVAAATCLSIGGALDTLPQPAQRIVADVIGAVLPVELPGQDHAGPDSPGPSAKVAPTAASPPSTRPSRAQGPSSRETIAAPGPLGPPAPPVANSAGGSRDPSPLTGDATRVLPGPLAPSSNPGDGRSPARALPGAVPTSTVPESSRPASLSPGTPEGAGSTRWSAALGGSSEVPGPGDADGSGTVSVELSPGNGQLCFRLATTAVAPITEIHLHEAGSGRAGPAVVTLIPVAEANGPGCVPLDAAVLKRMQANAAGFYVEVHNREFPDGALRGQLSS